MSMYKDSPTHVSRAPSVESPLLYSHEEGTTTQHLGRGREGGGKGGEGRGGEGRGGEGRGGGREGKRKEGERGRRSKQRRGGGGIERGWVRGKG